MSKESNKETVNYQFKILYAIGMILVVANHCKNGGVSLFYELFPAYTFHVALFIFCSGYFYNESVEQTTGKYIWKKVRSLIIPLYVWNFVYAMIAQILTIYGFSMGSGVTWSKLLIAPITSGHQFVYNLASWFVVPLFMVEVFNVLFRKVLSIINNTQVRELVYVIFAFILGMLGIYMASIGLNTGWWLVLARLLHFIPFYCVGFFYKRYLEAKDKLCNEKYFFIVIGLDLYIIIWNGGTLTYSQAWCSFTNFDAWPYVVGFLGIAFWLRIAKILEPVIGKSKCVNLIADNTFSIMVNQFLGFMLVKALFAIGANTVFWDFDLTAYHNDIWYYYIPIGLQQTRIIYVFVAIAFGIFIQLIINRIKDMIEVKCEKKGWKLKTVYLLICLTIVVCSGSIAYGIEKLIDLY